MSSYHDESLDPFIRDILPELEESLKKDLLQDMENQFQQEMRKEYARIEEQAVQQFQQALADLDEEAPKIQAEGIDSLQKQLQKLNKEKQAKQNHHLRTLQDRYISENFQELILGHPKIKQLEIELEEEIREQNMERIETAKQRKLKELLIKMENREQKERAQRDEAIRKQMYASNGIEDLKKDIETLRIGIASMKSEYNLKIKKIQTQIKEIKAKNKQIQRKQNINELRQQFQKLQEERDRLNERILAEEEEKQQSFAQQEAFFYGNRNNANESFSRNYSHLDTSSENSILKNPGCDVRYYNDDQHIVMESEGENYSSSEQDEENSNFEYEGQDGDIMNPPRYHPSFQGAQNSEQSYHQQEEIEYQPILNFNISKLLRSNWQTDPLQKYLNDEAAEEADKENDGSLGNKASNFQEMYRQHLEKLNKGTQKRKLSFNAKKTIIRNLSLLGRNKSGMLLN